MDPKQGYWQRQLYFLSSLGIFYAILIALFAIPLMGTIVVILIKGALELRYVIIAGGCVGLVVMGWIAVKLVRRFWRRLEQDGSVAGEAVRRNLLLGKSFEVSIFNGMLKFSCGSDQSDSHPALAQADRPLLPSPMGPDHAGSILDRLQHLSDLKQTGAIDAEEYNMLKALLLDASASSGGVAEEKEYH